VAVHLRRGDFTRHCYRLEKHHSTYMGFAQFPEFLDKFDPWKYKDYEERKEYYLEHCLPSVAQVAQKLWTVRTAHPGLKRVYVMTNGRGSWLRELRSTLLYDGWEDMKSSVDMQFDMAQKHVHMAVDMAIAEKAEVFIGNGVSVRTKVNIILRN
jgi:2-succinyl-5-enolpyruvyl-6-hydroxy-3-cyclohexene-1-carboxylate synthase